MQERTELGSIWALVGQLQQVPTTTNMHPQLLQLLLLRRVPTADVSPQPPTSARSASPASTIEKSPSSALLLSSTYPTPLLE